jgi:hypothetical protein
MPYAHTLSLRACNVQALALMAEDAASLTDSERTTLEQLLQVRVTAASALCFCACVASLPPPLLSARVDAS